MNITNQQQCLEQWEKDFLKTGDDSHIPPEDKDRVLHELDGLYNEMYAILVSLNQVPCVE
jgi:hypothetical protein